MSETLSGKMISDDQFRFLADYLSKKYGLRIPPEKKILLQSRLLTRINALKMESIDAYFEHLFKSNDSAAEYQLFVDQITTHKTFFFREKYQFDYMVQQLPEYVSKGNRQLNIWSAGCSTGEEVYTIGMVLNEKRNDQPNFDFKIVGTDVSVPSLKKASKGVFSLFELENISEPYRNKYFEITHGAEPGLQFTNREVISRINLGVLNLNRHYYNLPGNYDFIFCRNVIIYFDAMTRNEVLRRMVDKLKPGGYLFLGHSETALGTTLPLKSIKPTIYQKI